jgi:hypothetical protein
MSWLIDLKNQTKNEELKVALDKIECYLLKKAKDPFHKANRIDHNNIERPPSTEVDEEPEYYDDEPEGKTVRLMQLKASNLTCPEEVSDPTELPLSRESIGFDLSWVKVVQSANSSQRNSFNILLLLIVSVKLLLC